MRWTVVAPLLALAGCLPETGDDQPIVECEHSNDCNQAAGEVCEVGVCWGDPPVGTYAAVLAPPAELRGRLVKTAIPTLSMDPDGTLGNGVDHALSFDAAVEVRGVVSIPCPASVAGCSGRLGLAGQLAWSRPAAFAGGPRLTDTVDVGADGSFTIDVARPRVGAPLPFTVTFTPSQLAGPDGWAPAQFLAPASADVELDAGAIDLDTGVITRDLAFDPATQRVVHGRIVRPIADGPVQGWRVSGEVVTNPTLGARQVASTLVVTDELGEFDLRVRADTPIVDLVVAPPATAELEHRPSVRLRDVVVGAALPDLQIPLLGQPRSAVIDVRGVDGSGATMAIDGATVVVRLDQPLGGGAALVLEARATTLGGRASLPLFPVLDAVALPYKVDVLPPPGSQQAARYGTPLTVGTALGVALPRRLALTGRVRDHEGFPVAGAAVTAAVSQASLCVLSSDATRIALGQAPTQATTNPKGEFTMYVDGDLAGVDLTYDLTVRPASGDLRPEWTFVDRDPRRGGDLELPDAAHVRALLLSADHGAVTSAAITVYELLADPTGCASGFGPAGGVAVVRGRGESDDLGSAPVVLPRPAP